MNNSILILNCGSSSVKFSLINKDTEEEIINGMVEKIGVQGTEIALKYQGKKVKTLIEGADHEKSLTKVISQINKTVETNVVAVGHRVVHGGELFNKSCVVTDEVLAGIEKCSNLAPLHNPANILGILAVKKAYPNLVQVAVFDTAFHQTLPKKAYLYALPYKFYKDFGVRRYGFHGTSYRYICSALPEYIGDISDKKVIVAHIGNGGSVAAIQNGKVVDTSMGMTPLEGLVHGTRSGDIDPGVIEFICHQTNKSIEEVTSILWKESGLLGLSELSSDCRTIEDSAIAGEEAGTRALDAYVYRLIKYIGSYAAAMNGVDAIVFTGGVGENSDVVRSQTCANLQYLGFDIDEEINSKTIRGNDGNIAKQNSKPVLVIPTNEEKMIALDVIKLT